MAVYTTLSESQVNEMLARFNLPILHHMEGAGDGIENTTYFLMLADLRPLVLTIFEMLHQQQLPPYILLLQHFHLRGLPVPCPLLDSTGIALQSLANKPALLFPRAAGMHLTIPSIEQCTFLGKALAQLHLAAMDFPVDIPNPCGLTWAEHTATLVMPHLDQNDRSLLQEHLAIGRRLQSRALPRGVIHGDLFRDNVLFDGDHISAMIDFYNAGTDFFLLDLAIAINDWCFDDAGHHLEQHQKALMSAYESVRSLNSDERFAWQDCLKWAACRFWLSRLASALQPLKPGTKILKDPAQYRNLLIFYNSTPA